MCGILFITPVVEIDETELEKNTFSMVNLVVDGLSRSGNRAKDGGCGIAFYTPFQDYKLHKISKLAKPVALFEDFMKGYKAHKDKMMQSQAMIGHVRYATNGDVNPANIQPIMAHWPNHPDMDEEIQHGLHGITVAMAINGETWIQPEWEEHIKDVDIKGATSDSAKIAAMIVHNYSENPKLEDVLSEVYDEIFDYGMISATGILVDDEKKSAKLFWMADGGRPLCEALIDDFRLGISETVYPQILKHLSKNNVKGIKEIYGGTIRIQDLNARQVTTIEKERIKPPCFFERQYFQQHLSLTDGKTNASYRRKCGAALAEEHPPPIDDSTVITSVPDSGNSYAHGYAGKLKMPIYEIVCRSPLKHDVRTFIVSQDPGVRFEEAWLKFEINEQDCIGKKVVVVDDSIVRYNNLPSIVQKLWAAGASEVHLRIGCPPIINSCFSGINILPDDNIVKKLGLDSLEIANDHSLLEKKLEEYSHEKLGSVKVTSVGYLSVQALKRECGSRPHCFGCITGEYPYKFKDMEKYGAKFVPVKTSYSDTGEKEHQK